MLFINLYIFNNLHFLRSLRCSLEESYKMIAGINLIQCENVTNVMSSRNGKSGTHDWVVMRVISTHKAVCTPDRENVELKATNVS